MSEPAVGYSKYYKSIWHRSPVVKSINVIGLQSEKTKVNIHETL